MSIRRQEALDYHSQGRPGKIQVSPTKPFKNQRDLSLAYTPGVAEPCREIAARPEDAYTYTAKGNLVAVVTNGTAVLGLGNIGPLAGKPVMEGKGILFKAFADIDVFDLEVGSEDPEDMIRFCRLLEPTVGGINLEDIRSPDCFYIEKTLRDTLSIPVFHDDQHGTAIITGAALLNALEVVKKDIGSVQVVFAGAGACPAGGRRDAGRYRRGGADLDQDLPLLQAARTGQRAHFPESRRGEHQLQAAQPGGRRGGHRPDPGGDGTACACTAARIRGERYREHGRDCRRRRAGARSASAHLNLSSESTA
jgi:hypothetical protein